MKINLWFGISYARAIITRGLYIFYPLLEDHFFVFKEVFRKILFLCMVSIQKRFLIKSGLWWRVYSIWDILMQTSGTFGRHWGHMADIWQTLGRCRANVGQTFGIHRLGSWWVDIGQTLVGRQLYSSINPSLILKMLHLSNIIQGRKWWGEGRNEGAASHLGSLQSLGCM